jgi:hypothetical protein
MVVVKKMPWRGNPSRHFYMYGRKHVRPFQRRMTVRLYGCYVISMSVFYISRCCLLLF